MIYSRARLRAAPGCFKPFVLGIRSLSEALHPRAAWLRQHRRRRETGAALAAATDPFICSRNIAPYSRLRSRYTSPPGGPCWPVPSASHHEVWGRNNNGRSGFHFVSSIVLLDAFTAAVRASFSDPRWKFHDDHLLLRSTPKARDGKHALAPLALDDRAHPPVLG
jgi:hypothetical protein